ncbi:MAG: VanW family protein [Bacillota bacterium]|nr:VanW family protein [Bacillota bacterium]
MHKKWFVAAGLAAALVMGVIFFAGNMPGQPFLARLWSGQGAIKKPLHQPREGKKQEVAPKATPAIPGDDPGGAVGEPLPWAGNKRLETLKKRYNAPLLMAAYRARLSDPIMDEAYNIDLAAQMLAGTVVAPGEVFSMNKRLGPYTRDRGFKEGPMYAGTRIVPSVGGGVCKIASLLYNVAILSDLKIVERHPHYMTVPYVPPGQDATVAYGAYDFRFKNTSGGPILIWADMVGNSLYMAIYGQKKPPLVLWHHETLNRTKFWTKVQYNPSLPPGTEREVIPGYDGVVVRSWLTIKTADGEMIRRDLGTDYYRVCPRVIECGPVRDKP